VLFAPRGRQLVYAYIINNDFSNIAALLAFLPDIFLELQDEGNILVEDARLKYILHHHNLLMPLALSSQLIGAPGQQSEI
jgi:hypothetical protein